MAIVAIGLSSCDSDRDDQPNEKDQKVLLSKRTEIVYINGVPNIETMTFEYDSDNRLIKMKNSGGGHAIFEYDESGKPSKSYGFTENNTLTSSSTYEYANGKLILVKDSYNGSTSIRNYYSYDNNGRLVSIRRCASSNCGGYTYTYVKNNIDTAIDEDGNNFYMVSYSYDNKKNPYSSIDMHLRISLNEGDNIISENNFVEEISSRKIKGGAWSQQNKYTYKYKYNEQGYPTEMVDEAYNDKTFYEYIIR